jgi:hypothetical protein
MQELFCEVVDAGGWGMTHRDAPPRTAEQERCETFWTNQLQKRATTIGWSRDAQGRYHAQLAQDLWEGWQAAGRSADTGERIMTPEQEHCEHKWVEKLSPGGAVDRCELCGACRWHQSSGETVSQKEVESDSSVALQLRIVELEDFISAQRMAISTLLNLLEEIRQDIEEGDTDTALSVIEHYQKMAQGSSH